MRDVEAGWIEMQDARNCRLLPRPCETNKPQVPGWLSSGRESVAGNGELVNVARRRGTRRAAEWRETMERVLSGAVQSDVDVQLLELEGWAAWLEAGVAGPQAPVNFRLAPPCILGWKPEQSQQQATTQHCAWFAAKGRVLCLG